MKKKLLTLWLMTLLVSFSALADTWTIAGGKVDDNGTEAVLGSSWKVDDTNNDMTEISTGVWQLEKDVTLAEASSLYYKVVKDHKWDESYPSSNAYVALPAGNYKLVFTFLRDTHALSAIFSYTIVANDEIVYGNGEWTPTATANDMTKVDDDLYELTVKDVELTAGSYQYKVVGNHAWSVWEVPSSGNQTLTISEAGTYDIVYTLAPSTSILTALALKQNTYTIVGDAPLVIGDAWTPANDDNDMVKDDDDVRVYRHQVTGKKIPAGTYKYKAVYNHSSDWWPCVPNSDNASLVIAEDGVYTIDYTLTLGTSATGSDAEISAIPLKTGSATFTNNWLVVGSTSLTGYNWDASGAHNLMTDNGDGTYTLTFNNVAMTTDGTYEFKIVNNFYDGDEVIASNWYPENNQSITVLSNGNYDVTITYNPSTGDITQNVTAATQDFTVAINDPGWTEVWAYAYTGETPVVAWPGTKLTKADGKYTYTYNGTVAPANVVFNNGDGNGLQTPDLAFTDGTTYTDVWTIMGATQNSAWQNYTIEPIFTTAWTADVAGNDMTPSADGKTWTWTKSGVELEANTHIKYKATFGHCGTDYAVGTNEGDGMKVLDITDAGTYDLTFTFTRDGNTFAVNAEAVHAVTATKFTVAGSNSTLFDGYYWEPNPKTGDEYNNVNDMALVDGVWTITKTGKLLQAGNIEWKVAFDNAYNSYYGGIKGGDGDDKNDPGTNNAVLNIPVVGTYSVTFTYNPTTRKVNAVATKTADYDITSWCIAGNSAAGNVLGAGDWGFVDANLMTDQGDGKTWKLVKTPVTFTQAGTFEFKAFANKENIVVYPEGANASMAITAEDIAAGNYTLTFTLDTDAKTLVATKELVQNTYTATYVNTEDWENVYAYAWSGDGGSATIHTATWPGNKLTEKEATQVDGHDVYKFSIVLSAAPEKIIFNGGDGQPQTANLDFVDGKQYSFVATDTYTVAGSSTQLFGAEWNYSEGSGNDMTKGEGTSTVYTKSYANVALSAGNIEYKVFKAYNNSTTFPATNATLNIATMGMYNVTFTFDASTNEVSAVAERQGDIPLTYSYVLAGSTAVTGYNWDLTGAHNVMTAKGDGTYSLTVEDKTLEVGDNDGFKVVKLGTYGGKVYETTWIPDGMSNNKTVAIGEKGIYTITFTYDPTPGAANDGIAYSATPTQIEVPAISATGYATYSSAYALDFTDVTAFNAYIATGLDAQKQVVMAPAQQKVPAETGLVLAAEGGCEATLVPVAASAPAIGDNLLVAHVAAGDVAASVGSEYRYVLAKKDDEVGFYKLATTLNLPANRAYLQTTEALATNSTGKVSLIFDDDETTNINALTLGRSALDPTQPMYNISGQRVGNDYKGIVIQNGKKYVNK